MAAPRRGNTDSGWNDPPLFDFGNAPSSGPKRTLLNRRVAYPMSGGGAVESSLCTGTLLNPEAGPPKLGGVQLLPPAPNLSTPTPVPVLVPHLPGSPPPMGLSDGPHFPPHLPALSEHLSALGFADEDQYRKQVQHLLQLCLKKYQPTLSARAAEEVQRKFAAMEESWLEGHMSEPVKVQLGKLVTALEKGDIDEANQLHLSLMVDHTAEVRHWMVGIKHLVQEAKTLQTSSQSQEPKEEGAAGETEPTIPMFDCPPSSDSQLPSVPASASVASSKEEAEQPHDS